MGWDDPEATDDREDGFVVRDDTLMRDLILWSICSVAILGLGAWLII